MAKGESLQEKLKVLADIQIKRQGQFNFDPSELLSMAADYDERFDAISKNRGLNNIGRSDATGNLAKETFGRLTAWADKTLGGLRRRIDVERATLRNETGRPPTDPVEKLLLEIRQQEVRRAFEGLDEIEAELLFSMSTPEVRAALLSGPPVLRRAPDRTPRTEPLIKPEVADRVLLGEIESAYPREIEQIRELETLHGQYEALVNMFKMELRKQTRLVDEPVAVLRK